MADIATMTALPDFDPAGLPAEQIPAAVAVIGGWLTQLAARQMTAPAAPAADVRLLTVEEATAKLGVTAEWLYRRAKGLGLAVKLGDGTLRFSSVALDAYIKSQTIAAVPARRRRAS